MKKSTSYIVVSITLLLGVAGIVTAYLLSSRKGVTPVAPERPAAANNLESCELVSFTITSGTSTPSPSPSPSSSPSPTPTAPPPDTPSIDIEKHTNGYDADNPKGPQLTEGDDVKWEYIVTNTGSVALYNIVVTDDREGTINCPKKTLVVGETMTCTLHSTARVYQYENSATVVGEDNNGTVVTDTDMSHYWGEGKTVTSTPKPTSTSIASTPAPSPITQLPDTGANLPLFLIIPAIILLISAAFII